MMQREPSFSILFETTVACSDRGEKYLKPLHYNEFVTKIVRDSRWQVDVSFVPTNPTQGRLVSRNWDKVDFPNMVETFIVNGYTVTITDENIYEVTKTLDMATTERKNASTMPDKKGKKRHTGGRRIQNRRTSRDGGEISHQNGKPLE